ncbi:hypothetical protein ACHAXT_003528 [Thalassiosira profunda]
MMRKPSLLSCYASMAGTIRARGSSGMAAFIGPRRLAGGQAVAKNRHIRCAHHHSQRDLAAARIRPRQFGSRADTFRLQFAKGGASRPVDEEFPDDNDDGEDKEEYDEEADTNPHNFQPPNDIVRSHTLEWIKRVVIGYNLCPFAERPLRDDKLRISVVRGPDDEYVASAVAYELIARTTKPGTTVVVAPEYYPDDFVRYMSLVQHIEDELMDEHELHGVVQLAPFHPRFEFAGSGEAGVDNYTNRSPYPIFHILREDEVEGAVAKLGGDASKVWGRNVRLLEGMEERWGREGVERAMKGDEVEGMDELLREIKSGYSDKDN